MGDTTVNVYVPVQVTVRGTVDDARKQEIAEAAGRAVTARVAEAERRVRQHLSGPAAPPRQIRLVTLKKAEKILQYTLDDGSTEALRIVWYADVPPGRWPTVPIGPPTSGQFRCPEALRPFLVGRAGTSPHLLETNPEDRGKLTGTFAGVSTVDLVVEGATADAGVAETFPVADEIRGLPGLDELQQAPELIRLFGLRDTYRRYFPRRPLPAFKPLRLEDLPAVERVRQRLATLTELDWQVLERGLGTDTPATDWNEVEARLAHFLNSPERAKAMVDATTRDSRLLAAHADVDLHRADDESTVRRFDGLLGLYQEIKAYEAQVKQAKDDETRDGGSRAATDAEVERLTAAINARVSAVAGLPNVDAFDAQVRRLRLVVRRVAIETALTTMVESEKVLQAEDQHYRDPAVLNRLATLLRDWRRRTDAPSLDEVMAALTEYPILRSTVALKGALHAPYPEYLGELLRQNAQAQLYSIAKTRERLNDDPEVVFDFNFVIDEALRKLGLGPSTVQAILIREGRAKPDSVVSTLVDALLIALSFVGGPLLWVGLAARIVIVARSTVYSDEQGRAEATRDAANAGRPLATPTAGPGLLQLLLALSALIPGGGAKRLARSEDIVFRFTARDIRIALRNLPEDVLPELRSAAAESDAALQAALQREIAKAEAEGALATVRAAEEETAAAAAAAPPGQPPPPVKPPLYREPIPSGQPIPKGEPIPPGEPTPPAAATATPARPPRPPRPRRPRRVRELPPGAEVTSQPGVLRRRAANVTRGAASTPEDLAARLDDLEMRIDELDNPELEAELRRLNHTDPAAVQRLEDAVENAESFEARSSNAVEDAEEARRGLEDEVSARQAGIDDPTPNYAREELRQALGNKPAGGPGEWQAHHIIPYQLRVEPLVEDMTRRYGFNINGRGNGIWLPKGPEVASGEGLTIHFGPHSKYTSFVRSRLDQLWQQYSLGVVPESQILRRFEDLIGEFEDKLRSEAFGKVTDEGRIHVK